MSLVHERLYKTQELSRIDLADYISKLAEELLRSQKIAQKVELDLDIHGIFLDINLAIPVGLILNEILTNSLKYAFPDGRQGKISISAEKSSEAYTIRIADNGVGIPEDLRLAEVQYPRHEAHPRPRLPGGRDHHPGPERRYGLYHPDPRWKEDSGRGEEEGLNPGRSRAVPGF